MNMPSNDMTSPFPDAPSTPCFQRDNHLGPLLVGGGENAYLMPSRIPEPIRINPRYSRAEAEVWLGRLLRNGFRPKKLWDNLQSDENRSSKNDFYMQSFLEQVGILLANLAANGKLVPETDVDEYWIKSCEYRDDTMYFIDAYFHFEGDLRSMSITDEECAIFSTYPGMDVESRRILCAEHQRNQLEVERRYNRRVAEMHQWASWHPLEMEFAVNHVGERDPFDDDDFGVVKSPEASGYSPVPILNQEQVIGEQGNSPARIGTLHADTTTGFERDSLNLESDSSNWRVIASSPLVRSTSSTDSSDINWKVMGSSPPVDQSTPVAEASSRNRHSSASDSSEVNWETVGSTPPTGQNTPSAEASSSNLVVHATSPFAENNSSSSASGSSNWAVIQSSSSPAVAEQSGEVNDIEVEPLPPSTPPRRVPVAQGAGARTRPPILWQYIAPTPECKKYWVLRHTEVGSPCTYVDNDVGMLSAFNEEVELEDKQEARPSTPPFFGSHVDPTRIRDDIREDFTPTRRLATRHGRFVKVPGWKDIPPPKMGPLVFVPPKEKVTVPAPRPVEPLIRLVPNNPNQATDEHDEATVSTSLNFQPRFRLVTENIDQTSPDVMELGPSRARAPVIADSERPPLGDSTANSLNKKTTSPTKKGLWNPLPSILKSFRLDLVDKKPTIQKKYNYDGSEVVERKLAVKLDD